MGRHALYIAFLLAGCNGLSATGSSGIVGRLISNDGEPLRGVRVESEEQSTKTNAAGEFQVLWKDPATFVRFEHGGVAYKRGWMRDDDVGRVDVRLPLSEETLVSCQPVQNCTAEIAWELDGGLSGEARVECAHTAPQVKLERAPRAEPVVVCRSVTGAVPINVERSAGMLRITSPSPGVQVLVEGDKPCAIDSLHGTQDERSRFTVPRPTWAWAVCEGRVGQPVPIAPELKKAAVYPPKGAVDVAAHGHATLYLLRLSSDGSAEWQMRINAHEGVFKLPALARGEYRAVLGGLGLLGRMNPPEPEIPGTVVFHDMQGEGYLGALRLEEDMAKGTLRVDGL